MTGGRRDTVDARRWQRAVAVKSGQRCLRNARPGFCEKVGGRMDDQELAGIARDSCPHCGQRVKVAAWKLIPSSYGNATVTCAACGKESQVAGRTRIGATLAGTGGMIVGMWGYYLIVDRHASLTAALCGFVVAAYAAGRLTMRLDPPEFAD